MKKILFLLLFIPFCVNATVLDYYMEANVLDNGDVYVKEVFDLDGSYNGFDRELILGDNNYSGDSIDIIKVMGISDSNVSFDTLKKSGDVFTLKNASSGSYGYYYVTNISNGINIRIFNPSHKNKLFYIEYIVRNMAIKHNDVGEVGYNIFTSLNEPVSNLNVRFIIPGNKNIIKVWNHGPLIGYNKIDSINMVSCHLDYLYAYEKIDMRVVFDSSVLVNSKKIDNNNILDNIIEDETKKADEANKEREDALKKLEELYKKIEEAIIIFKNDRTQKNKDYALSLINGIYGTSEYEYYYNEVNSILSYEEERALFIKKIISFVFSCGCFIYLGYGLYNIYKFYQKYDKEYKASFNNKYYRDFPFEYGPEYVEYLIDNNISTVSFSASILNLIYKKNISYEEIDKKNYSLKLINKDNISDSEEKLINCIFGNKNVITLKELKVNAKNNYYSFISKYNSWNKKSIDEAKKMGFFEKNKKTGYVLYSLCSFMFVFCSFLINPILIFFVIFFAIFSILYYLSASKRSKEGNEYYYKWIGLKNFMKDFGRMDEKELPEIILWEKYLVYATVFGIADKLSKTMEIKVKEYSDINTSDIIKYNQISNIVRISSVVGSTISKVKTTADSAYAVAHSSSSSGGGTGGGFSSGGGSFGGGGGGGRF